MVLFNFNTYVTKWMETINRFLERNGNNLLFWILLLMIFIIVTFGAIRYFNKK